MAELTDTELETKVAEAMGWRFVVWEPSMTGLCNFWEKPNGEREYVTDWHPLKNKAQAWEMLEWLIQQSSALIIDRRHVCVHLTEPPYKENVRQAWHTNLARAVCEAAVEVGKE